MRINWGDFDVESHESDTVDRRTAILQIMDVGVVDAETGVDVGRDITWADDVAGEYEEIVRGPDGKPVLTGEDVLRRVIKRPIRFVWNATA